MPDKKYHILAIDDEIHNLEAIERTLRKKYRVSLAGNAAEALRIFEQEDIHLVITDQLMPDILGTDLLAKMQQINPNPVRIVLSAYTEIDYLIDAINKGQVYNYITKPWEPAHLLLIIQKAIEFYQLNMDRLALSNALKSTYSELATSNTSLEQASRELAAANKKLLEMERLSVISKMARMVTHDLRQPLDIIRSAADTMTRTDLETEDRTEIADMIRSEVDTFLEMINELLEFTRGSFDFYPVEITVADFFAASEIRLKSTVQDSNISLIINSVPDGFSINIDRKLLQRALINLLNNAIEAFQKQKKSINPTVNISAIVQENQVEIVLADNGPGIPSDIADKIFEPFVSTRKTNGFGLGLAIVREIIRRHEGEIQWVPTTVGTTFKITLPLLPK